MKAIRHLLSETKPLGPCVVSIGNFDGLHRGHQAVIARLLTASHETGSPAVVVSFDPYPKEYFLGDRVPRLMTWREKYVGLKALGVSLFATIRFNATCAKMTADEFIQRVILQRLQARVVVIGDDFHFGKDRAGDYKLLCEAGAQYGFHVIQVPTFEYMNERVSSSRIRYVLQAGNMEMARALLGHDYQLWGTVIHGDKLGRQLGFPTANIALHRRRVPLSGVFVVQVRGIDKKVYQGVANIGTRPAVNGTRVLLEVFIFDFDREIYGAQINVVFLHKLRDEQNYDDLAALKRAIEKDVVAAKQFFKNC